MTVSPSFDRLVFINCPFDEAFAPLLQAIAFCVTDLGLDPRIALESPDNSANRLDRVVEIIRSSKFSIHDLSRCKASGGDEYYRQNMPFELGIDHGCSRFGEGIMKGKAILVLEQDRYDHQKSLSDISGWDIHAHSGDHIEAVRIVRTWPVRQAGVEPLGPAKIQGDYLTFQEWYWERETERGASDEDIKAYPTVHMI
jgi:hypothetical protein